MTLEFIDASRKKYLKKIKQLYRNYERDNVDEILFGIVQNKGENGWTNWDFFSGKIYKGENIAIINDLEENDLIVQKEGPFELVKVKNHLVEEIILENIKVKAQRYEL